MIAKDRYDPFLEMPNYGHLSVLYLPAISENHVIICIQNCCPVFIALQSSQE